MSTIWTSQHKGGVPLQEPSSLRKILRSRFVGAITLFLICGYTYLSTRLELQGMGLTALFILAVLLWIFPVRYWVLQCEPSKWFDDAIHQGAYFSMGSMNYLLFLTIFRDLFLLAASLLALDISHWLTPSMVAILTVLATIFSIINATRGPRIERQSINFTSLDPRLAGLKIAQISDLHAGFTISRKYVANVVEQTISLNPDIVVLTGDLVDGNVDKLAAKVEPLKKLAAKIPCYFVLGNHEYYSGAEQWIEYFANIGCTVLRNQNAILTHNQAKVLIGGVVDPAGKLLNSKEVPNAKLAAQTRESPIDLRILLAHNPKLAKSGATAGFDLQLSGHTHGGQFFPWNLVVKLVHAPHITGLSQEGSMKVYVSAGTGSWGPPFRLGTSPELTLLTLGSH